MGRAILVTLAVAASGCLAAPERGIPLYSASTAPIPISQVATLEVRVPYPSTPGTTRTFIQAVDGRDVVDLASPFELLPGCHVVETDVHWASTKARYIYLPGVTGAHMFPIRMRPGHTYTVVEEWSKPFGPLNTVSIHAVDQDPAGGPPQEISAATSDADVQACRAWTPPTS